MSPKSSRAIAFAALLLALDASPEELQLRSDRLFVTASVNGVSTTALLDSAAELSFLDADFARRLSLVGSSAETARGTGAGTQQVSLVENVDIESLGVRLSGLTVAVLDLRDISDRLIGERVSMVLGRELFDSGRFLVDIAAGEISRIDSNQEPTGVRLPLQENRGIKQLPVSLEGSAPVYADFDLGNGGRVLVGQSYASDHGLLDERRIVGTEQGGGIGGALTRNLVLLQSVEIAGETFLLVPAAIDPTEDASAANIGVAILKGFVMTIDFPANAIWLSPAGK